MYENIIVLTALGGEYQLTDNLQEKLVVLSNGEIYVHESYKNDVDIINQLGFFKNLVTKNGSGFTSREQIHYVAGELIRGYYTHEQRGLYLNSLTFFLLHLNPTYLQVGKRYIQNSLPVYTHFSASFGYHMRSDTIILYFFESRYDLGFLYLIS